jgi:hypothetical protein
MSYDSTILADSPEAYYPLNESVGSLTVADATGHAHTGTVHGGVTFGAASLLAGDPATGARFDGSSGYISIPFAAALNSALFSVEVWVEVTGGNGGYRALVSNRDLAGGSEGWVLYDKDSNQFAAWAAAGGGSWNHADATATTTLSTGYYMVGTWDGTNTRLYLNGALVATSANGSYLRQSVQELRIGAGQNESTPAFFLPGLLQKVAIYQSVLTPTQITAHYTAGTTAGSSVAASVGGHGGLLATATPTTTVSARIGGRGGVVASPYGAATPGLARVSDTALAHVLLGDSYGNQ